MATPTQRLGDLLLGGDGQLRAFVRERRDRQRPVPWRLIARELYEHHEFDVTHEALRSWFPDEPDEAVG